MAKVFGTTGVIIVLGFIVQYFFPWWTIAIVTFLVAAYQGKGAMASFGVAFLAVSILWSGYAGIMSNINGGILAGRMGELFSGGLPFKLSGMQLIYFTGVLGGIVGGLGAITGSLAKDMLRKES